MNIVVINLKRRPDRKEYVREKYKTKYFNVKIFPAYDGHFKENNSDSMNKFCQDFLKKIKINEKNTDRKKYKYNTFSNLKKGEVGCFVSHLYLWKKIHRNPEFVVSLEKLSKRQDDKFNTAWHNKYTLIMEDDCNFAHNFDDIIESILEKELREDINIIWLGTLGNTINYIGNNQKITKNISLRTENTNYGTFGYLISKDYAKLLFDYVHSEFIGFLGIDYFMNQFLRNNNHPQHLSEPSIINSEQNQSSISQTDIQID